MYYCQDANMYEKVTSVISWNCPHAKPNDNDTCHNSTGYKPYTVHTLVQ